MRRGSMWRTPVACCVETPLKNPRESLILGGTTFHRSFVHHVHASPVRQRGAAVVPITSPKLTHGAESQWILTGAIFSSSFVRRRRMLTRLDACFSGPALKCMFDGAVV